MRVEIPIVVLNPVSPYNPVENAQVAVTNRVTGLTANVYTTSSGSTLKSLPLLTDSSGRVDGWVERGSYAFSITIPGRPAYIEYFEASPAGDGSIDTDWLENDSVTTSKIDDDAVTSAKLGASAVDETAIASNAVTAGKIASSSVTTAKIASGAVTSDKIDSSTVATVPLGTILDWFPPAAGSPPWTSSLPPGYAVCDGTAWASIPNDLGYSTGNIPNLVGKVTHGANASYSAGTAATHDSATGSQTPPGVGGNVGANTIDKAHSHNVPAHQHGMSHEHTNVGTSHRHLMNHSHGVNGHQHSIPYKTEMIYYQSGESAKSLTYFTFGAQTGSSGSTTDGGDRTYTDYSGDIPTTGVNKVLTDQSSVVSTTSNPSGYWDSRNSGVGVLKIMKVKNL